MQSSESSRPLKPLAVAAGLFLWCLLCIYMGVLSRDNVNQEISHSLSIPLVSNKEKRVMRFGYKARNLKAWHDQMIEDSFATTDAWYLYAQAATQVGFYGKAVMAYRRILSRKPNDVVALQRLADLYLTTERVYVRDKFDGFRFASKAMKLLQPIKSGYHDITPRVYATYAEAMYQFEQHDEAVKFMQLSIEYTKNPHPYDVDDQQERLSYYRAKTKGRK